MAEEKKTEATMKAVVATTVGAPKDVLKLMDVPIPKVTKPTEILVKVLYASINPIDYKMVSGMMGIISPKKPPFIQGRDFSGRIVEKGTDPTLRDFAVGDLVYGQCWMGNQGSFAEYCLCIGKNVQKMPKAMTPLQAASVPLVAQTSYQALSKMKLKKGAKLLILGGSTSTGIMAIQIAKNFLECGEVIVTASQEELVKSFGADRVINYKKEEWFKVLKNYNVDAIYDCVGGEESWDKCKSEGVLKKTGWYISIVGDKAHGDTFSVTKLIGTGFSLVNRKFWGSIGNQQYDLMMADSTKNLRDVTTLIDANKLKTILDPESPFKFEDYLKVFDKSMSRRAKGKLVIHVSDDEKVDKAEDIPVEEEQAAVDKDKDKDEVQEEKQASSDAADQGGDADKAGGWKKAESEEIFDACNAVKPDVEAQAAKDGKDAFKIFEAVEGTKQVVAGMNFKIKVKVDDDKFIEILVYRSLPPFQYELKSVDYL